MLHLQSHTTGGPLDVWAETNPLLQVSQDSWLVVELPGRLRLAAIDGITPTDPAPWRLGLDRASWAAQTICSALQADAPIAACLALAHAEILDESIRPLRARPQAAVVVADILPGRSCQIVRAGDCQAWAREATGWRQVTADDTLAPATRCAFDALLARRAELTRGEFVAAEATLTDDPATRLCTPVGLMAELRLMTYELDAAEELVLASDGALLTPDRLVDLAGWLAGLRSFEREHGEQIARYKAHDDVTALRLCLSADGA